MLHIRCFINMNHIASSFFISHHSVINSRFSHPSNSAIRSKVGSVGWVMLLHHLETVTGETPNSSASHTPVLFFSTKTTFNRFKSLLTMFNNLNFNANKINNFQISKFFFENHAQISMYYNLSSVFYHYFTKNTRKGNFQER